MFGAFGLILRNGWILINAKYLGGKNTTKLVIFLSVFQF